MAEINRPNLFHWATSELSQDAFICWLAAWADQQWQDADPALHQTARAFVASMIRKTKPDYDPADITTVDVKRQVEKLDILIKVNKETANKLAILVEDKTHTSNHSDQLNRYYKRISESGYAADQMVPLYFKTGYQSKFETLGVFETYLRTDFLEILRQAKTNNVNNAILEDFLSHLEKIDAAVQQFSTKAVDQWEDDDWQGFFMVLYDNRNQLYDVNEKDDANWGYVANPAGGFFGYWWYFMGLINKPYWPYLQLEKNTLCFKIGVENESDRRRAREDAYWHIQQAASQLNASVIRPDRMGNGKYMTVARWLGDYRVFADGRLDLAATITNLQKAQPVLDLSFANDQQAQSPMDSPSGSIF